ncbi:sigma-70 family RNA polymerase sigma factor [Arenimonas sp.]|uniref:sigma-70 family RNA polymerase sigma factor n=1 Tax=Arenimonas sp. TaxID=1872635 RepID=UPI0039E55766
MAVDPHNIGRETSASNEDSAQLAELLERIGQRDSEALSRLYELTLGRVYAVAMRVLENPADAQETVGDVYLQVWSKAADYRTERGEPMAWLQTLAWSRALDRRRRRQRQSREVELHPEEAQDTYTECEEISVEQAAERWWSARAVRRAFVELSEAQQVVLRMLFEEDMSQQEVAEKTGWPLGTVKSHSRRGLAVLREALLKGGQDHA